MAMYRYKYGLKDFIKILFYKKRCPICNQKIKRKKEYKKYTETDQMMIYDYGRNAYDVIIYYVCENCGKRIEVSEL